MALPNQGIIFDSDNSDLNATQVLTQATGTAAEPSAEYPDHQNLRAHHGTTNDFSGHSPAGFGVRLVALAIDGLLFATINKMAVVIVAMALGADFNQSETDHQLGLMMISMALAFCYYMAPLYVSGQTLGKKLFKIQVVNRDMRGDLSWGQVIGRETIGKFLSSVTLLFGYLLAAIRKDKRSLHDLVAGTHVIKLNGGN